VQGRVSKRQLFSELLVEFSKGIPLRVVKGFRRDSTKFFSLMRYYAE
jgi:hypothetical protein